MPSIDIIRESNIVRTPRVKQIESIFDIPLSEKTGESWSVNLPIEEKKWNVGLIVGPSGCGKTTLINEMFGQSIVNDFEWPDKKSILDGFPKNMGIKDISSFLSSVGFSSPPSWVRPYSVLSNGEKFRVHIARVLAEAEGLCVVDEFSSVVDRTVAKIGSSAISKTVRRFKKQFIAVTCHEDVEEWLQPDWVYRVHDKAFEWRFLQQRPKINLEIAKVHRSAWRMFSRYHYLDAKIHNAAQCFVAFWDGMPVGFMSYLHFMNNRLKRTKKGHRAVVLPDYQGVGIGNTLIEYIASCLIALDFDFIGRTATPGIIYYRARSKKWKMIRKPEISVDRGGRGKKSSVRHRGRIVATFRYVGPKAKLKTAEKLLL